MRPYLFAAAAAAALACASSAEAAEIFTVRLTGKITGSSDPTYSPLRVGDELVLTAQFTSDFVARNWDGQDYSIAGTNFSEYNGLTDEYRSGSDTPGSYWQIKSRDFRWTTNDDLASGPTRFFSEQYEYERNYIREYSYQRSLFGPGITFQDGKVLGVGLSAAFYGHYHPAIRLDRGGVGKIVDIEYENYCGGTECDQQIREFTRPGMSPNFTLGPSIYFREGPTFTGEWDFASSWVSVPEPSSWSLMILGFGVAGSAFRRRAASQAYKGVEA